MKIISFMLLLIAFVYIFLLMSALRSISTKELKRRARSGDKIAERLYKTAAYGASADILLWLLGGSALGLAVVLGHQASWWLALIIVIAALLLLWTPKKPGAYGSAAWSATSMLSVPISKLLSWLQPVLGRLGKKEPALVHAGIYEKADLLDLLSHQNHRVDNRIPEADLKLAFNALQLGDKTVGMVMKPRRSVSWVNEDDSIGPLLMDELHASGLTSFPVINGSAKKNVNPEVVGTLYLSDLIGKAAGGRVGDAMAKKVYFINESDTLRAALAAFNKTHQHLLVVVNNFEEVVGVLTFDQMLALILGESSADTFDQYHDKKAVAAKAKPAA